MRQSTRLIVNMVAAFGRMAITLVLSLVSTRLIVGGLGEVEYGLLSVLGASGLVLALVTTSLTASVQRHLAYEIGRRDRHALRVVFNTSLGLFLVGGCVLWAVGAAVAPWLVGVLQKPAGREQAVFWVFHITLLTVVSSTWSTPFRAMATARQSIVFLAVFEVATAVNRLLVAVAILFSTGDRLVQFAMLLLAGQLLITTALVASSMVRFPETRPRLGLFSWASLRDVGEFSGWTLLQRFGVVLRFQGPIFFLNVFFGELVNAAYALAVHLANYEAKMMFTISQVTLPAMTAAEAQGNRTQVRALCVLASKYTLLACLCAVVPLMLETETLLRLWLGSHRSAAVIHDTAIFLRLVMAWLTLGVATRGHNMAVMAVGNIGRYVSVMTVLNVSALVLPTVWYWCFGAPPWAFPAASIGISALVTWYRLVVIGRLIDLPIGAWLRRTLIPTLLVAAPALGVACAFHFYLPEGPLRALAVAASYGLAALPMAWRVLESSEKEHFRRVAAGALARLKLHTAGD